MGKRANGEGNVNQRSNGSNSSMVLSVSSNRCSAATVSFGDYELLGDAADIMARQRTRQRW
jgi:hypothetical protein